MIVEQRQKVFDPQSMGWEDPRGAEKQSLGGYCLKKLPLSTKRLSELISTRSRSGDPILHQYTLLPAYDLPQAHAAYAVTFSSFSYPKCNVSILTSTRVPILYRRRLKKKELRYYERLSRSGNQREKGAPLFWYMKIEGNCHDGTSSCNCSWNSPAPYWEAATLPFKKC
jgi:hypothetical protein